MKNRIKIFEQIGQGWAFLCILFGIAGLTFFYSLANSFDFLNYLLGSASLRIAVFSYWIDNYRILVKFPDDKQFQTKKYLTFYDKYVTVCENSETKIFFWEDITSIFLIRKYFLGYSIIQLEIVTKKGEVFLIEESTESFFYLISKIPLHFPLVSKDFFEKFSMKSSLPEREKVFAIVDQIIAKA